MDGDIYVMIVGNNQAGFELSFAKDAATVVNAEFHAMPMDSEGTLIVYEEEVIEDGAAAGEEPGTNTGNEPGGGNEDAGSGGSDAGGEPYGEEVAG